VVIGVGSETRESGGVGEGTDGVRDGKRVDGGVGENTEGVIGSNGGRR
jgi:hypothetical protein